MQNPLIIAVNHWFKRETIVSKLEIFQDFIVISLCLSLFCVMLLRLGDLFTSFLHQLDIRQVTSDILFILILLELFRLLIDYLQQRSISVGAAVEITIVSALREIILRGVLEIPRDEVFSLSLFLLVLSSIFMVLPWAAHYWEHAKTVNSQITESK